MDCMRFYAKYGGDGRNHTARSVYECFFDPNNGVCNINYSETAMFNIKNYELVFVAYMNIILPFSTGLCGCRVQSRTHSCPTNLLLNHTRRNYGHKLYIHVWLLQVCNNIMLRWKCMIYDIMIAHIIFMCFLYFSMIKIDSLKHQTMGI